MKEAFVSKVRTVDEWRAASEQASERATSKLKELTIKTPLGSQKVIAQKRSLVHSNTYITDDQLFSEDPAHMFLIWCKIRNLRYTTGIVGIWRPEMDVANNIVGIINWNEHMLHFVQIRLFFVRPIAKICICIFCAHGLLTSLNKVLNICRRWEAIQLLWRGIQTWKSNSRILNHTTGR